MAWICWRGESAWGGRWTARRGAPITSAELGLELVPMDEGLWETFRWYQSQQRPPADYFWEDGILAK